MRYEHDPHYALPLPDEYRTFYPYTPNEVKHRRRTTSAQLKVLEAVFRVDTKPNATLRNDLAAQLGMTARGVQVWFQNRRAKEKNKTNKKQNGASATAAGSEPASTDNKEGSPKDEDETEPASPPPETPGEELLEELLTAEPPHDVPQNQQVDSQTNSPAPALNSPPKLHLLTDPALSSSSGTSWKPTPSDETPPDSAELPSRPSLVNILGQRRTSLPCFFGPFTTNASTPAPRSIDAWDPLARRRSVDTSLQRLVMHPYAQHARARNGVLFGPHSPSQSQPSRLSIPPGKKSIPLRRPNMPHRPPPNQYLDMRRASMDPRTLMSNQTDGLSPSQSPLPLHSVRASLPDTSLFTSSRRYVPQIPGPLPEPNFTFGAASVSSPTDDEPPSPNLSSYSFPPKDDSTDDDVMSSISFETLSRFGSAVSIATSESSVFSNSAFYDLGELAPNQDRRSSCGSTQMPCGMANLDGAMQPFQQSPAPVINDGYFDQSSTALTAGANLDSQPQPDGAPSTSSLTSPASTASPDGCSVTQSSTPPANIPISSSSELVSVFTATHGSQKLSVLDDGSSLRHAVSSEQLQQPHSELSSQQQTGLGHQCGAVETLAGHPHTTGPVLLGQDATGAHPMNEQMSRDALLNHELPQARGEFTASYPNLMAGFDLNATLAMFDNVSNPSVISQANTEDSANCNALANLGLGGGEVASGPYGAASGIVPNHPTFAS